MAFVVLKGGLCSVPTHSPASRGPGRKGREQRIACTKVEGTMVFKEFLGERRSELREHQLGREKV